MLVRAKNLTGIKPGETLLCTLAGGSGRWTIGAKYRVLGTWRSPYLRDDLGINWTIGKLRALSSAVFSRD